MKSNRCLSNKAVFKSDITRFLPFSIILFIVELFIFPIAVYGSSNYSYYSELNPNMTRRLQLNDFIELSAFSDVAVFIFAAVIALLVFSYLYSSNKCNAIHAFPIGRKSLYVTGLISGYAMLVVPQLIAFAIAVPGLIKYLPVYSHAVPMELASIFVRSLIYYSVAVLAVMLAGNIFAGTVIYGILNFVVPFAAYAVNSIVATVGIGLQDDVLDLEKSLWFSPGLRTVFFKSEGYGYENTQLWTETKAHFFGGLYRMLIVYAIASVVLFVLAFLLYKARKLECAGDMAAFRIEIPVLSIIGAIVGGYLFLLLFALIFDDELDLVVSVIIYAIFAFISYFAAQMVLRKRAKVFTFKRIIAWALTVVMSIVLCFAVAAVEGNYIPKAEKIKSAEVTTSYSMEITDPERLEKVISAHRKALDAAKEKGYFFDVNNRYYNYVIDYADDGIHSVDYMYINYTFKNGKTVTRNYVIDFSNKDVRDAVDALETACPAKTIFTALEGVNYDVVGCYADVFGKAYQDTVYIDKKDIDTLLTIARKEEAEYLDGYLSSSNNPRRQMATVMNICFECKAKSERDAEILDNISYGSPFSGWIDYMYYNRSRLYVSEEDANSFSINLGVYEDSEVYKFITENYKATDYSITEGD